MALVSSRHSLSSCSKVHLFCFNLSLLWSSGASAKAGGYKVFSPNLHILGYFYMLICMGNLMPLAHFLGAFDQSKRFPDSGVTLSNWGSLKEFLIKQASLLTGLPPPWDWRHPIYSYISSRTKKSVIYEYLWLIQTVVWMGLGIGVVWWHKLKIRIAVIFELARWQLAIGPNLRRCSPSYI